VSDVVVETDLTPLLHITTEH